MLPSAPSVVLARARNASFTAILLLASCSGGDVNDGSGHVGTAGTSGGTGRGGTSPTGNPSGRGGTSGTGNRGGTGLGIAGSSGVAGTGTTGPGTAGASGGYRGGRGGSVATPGGTGGHGGSSGVTGTAGTTGRAGTTGTGGAPPIGKKFVGNIDTRGQVRSDFIQYWNQISPENAGKWGSVERTRNQMDWSALDAIHDYAKQHNIPFKQHNFVWGSQQPGWIGGLSQADQRAEVEEWIKLYCTRYPDTQLIDVVNEPPPHTMPAYIAALGGAGKSGYDWIAQAFTWAHQYCPNAILILNDYNNIELAGDNSHTIEIVKAIKSVGAPINAVGAQAHGCANLSASTVQKNIDNIATQTGLPVYITKYDLNIADDTQQKNVMQSQFTMFWNDPNVAGVTIWGYIVGATWETNSGLMTSAGSMRPAMSWLMSFLGR